MACLRLVCGSFGVVCLSAGVLLAASCRNDGSVGGVSEPAQVAAVTSAAPASAAQIVAAVHAQPGSPVLPAVASGFNAGTSGLAPQFSAAAMAGEQKPATVVLPKIGSGAMHLQDNTSGAAVDVTLSGAASVSGQTSGGYVVYPAVLASNAALLHRPIASGSEDFIYFPSRPSAAEVDYTVAIGSGIAGLRVVGNVVEMLDAGGTPRMRVAPPYIVGSDGVSTDGTLDVPNCTVDTDPSAPWGRAVTDPGAKTCTVRVTWSDALVKYPAVLDPRWVTTGSMATARFEHQLLMLSSGKALAVGGRSSTSGTTGLTSAELYNPTNGTWASTGSLANGRRLFTLTQLPTSSNSTTSGKILAAGGISGSTSLTSAELYSVSAGTWSAAATMNAARHQHTATLLVDGRVMVAGGFNGTQILQSAATYNPASGTGTWAATTGPIPPPGLANHTATLIQTTNSQLNNHVLLVGGNNGTSTISAVYLYDPVQNAFSTLASISSPREQHTAAVLPGSNGKILIAGGKNGSSVLNTAISFDPSVSNGTWASAGTMTSARVGHTMVVLPTSIVANGKVLVTGGSSTGSNTLSSAELFSDTTLWTATPSMPGALQAAQAVVLSGNMVLVAGGLSSTGTVSSAAFLYDASFGLGCPSNSQCASGFCSQGVCCDSACTGTCGACNLAGHLGTCTALSSGTVCRTSAGACDVAETCNGSSTGCPPDSFALSGTVCRPAAGECDAAETCSGTSVSCPTDAKQASGTACTDDGNPCTTDQCDGTHVGCQHPAGNAGAVCRAQNGVCDVAETCTGTSASCPADGFVSAGTVCRAVADVCDVAETCTGSAADCPADAFLPATTVCRPSAGQCDVAESCTGSSATCPANGLAPSGTACSDGNACTLGDSCLGGACIPGTGTVSCAPTDQCHQAGQCNPQTGACSTGPLVADWTPCSGGDLCTHGNSCQAGVCGGGLPTCQDGDPCTVDSCNATNGSCQFTAMTPDQCTAFLQANPPEALKGRIAFASESDNNRCVPHASRVLNRMNATGEVMGWQFLKNGYEDLEGEVWHAETLLRLPYFDPSVNPGTVLDGSYFMSAFSHGQDDTPYHTLGVAHLGFKGGNQGRMLLTNRAYSTGNQNSTVEADWNVTPHPDDAYVPFANGSTLFTLDPAQNHPGGGAALGWHVVVAMQIFDDGAIFGVGTGGSTPLNSQTKVVTLDVSQPLSPVIKSTFVAHQDPVELLLTQGNSALSAAITKLNNGHFLLAVEKDKPTTKIEFYVSPGVSLDDAHPFGPDLRDPDTVIPLCGGAQCSTQPYGWQSFNFITDCNGDLYMLGERGDVGDDNNDMIDNFKVEVVSTNNGTAGSAGYAVTTTSVDQVPTGESGEASKHMYCPDNVGDDQCDFQAAAGSYVDPQGQVIIYSSDYDPNGGPDLFDLVAVYGNGAGDINGPWLGQSCPNGLCGNNGGFYHGMEFHERHGNAAIGSACPTWDNAWVEFYQQTNFNNFGDGNGEVYRANYLTRDERNGYLGANAFNDKAQSVRWCVPPGSSIQLFEDVWQGPFTFLNGSGQVMEADDLSVFHYPYTTPGSTHAAGDSLVLTFPLFSVTTGTVSTFQFFNNHTDPQGIVGTPDARF